MALEIRKTKSGVPARRGTEYPFYDLHKQMDRLFDDFFGGSYLEPLQLFEEVSFRPNVNVMESDKEVSVTAELPGMDKNDVTLELTKDSLTIAGEKKAEHEEKEKGFYWLIKGKPYFDTKVIRYCYKDEDFRFLRGFSEFDEIMKPN